MRFLMTQYYSELQLAAAEEFAVYMMRHIMVANCMLHASWTCALQPQQT
jgi:hypothetical protein